MCCFKKVDFLWLQLKHFGFSYINLFLIISLYVSLTTKTISLAFFTFWTLFYTDSSTFLITLFNFFVIIKWFDLNSSSNSFLKYCLLKIFSWFFIASIYFIYGFKNVNFFFIRINFNEHKTKFFFYYSLSLCSTITISVIMT